MHLGTFRGEAGSLFDGLELELTRWDGKGFTCLRAAGPRARDLVAFVAGYVAKRIDRHVKHVRHDVDGPFAVEAWGRKRQCSAVIVAALEAFSFDLAGKAPGTNVPIIRFERQNDA